MDVPGGLAHWCAVSRSQETQAGTPTAHTGTQCALGLFTSVGCQTEANFSDAEEDLIQLGCRGFPASLGDADSAADASQEPQGEHKCTHGLSHTRKPAWNHWNAQVRDICISQSREQSSLRTVIVTFPLQVQGYVFACSVCKQAFRERASLYAHMKLHGDEKSYSCRFCPKSFCREQLDVHERSHYDEERFVCSVCQKDFCSKTSLAIHERSHTGEKPFVCSVCKKAFAKKSCLVVHERLHTGEKPYTCKYCPDSFARRDRFLIHERVHTGEQPFVCGICQKSFAEKRNLIVHEKSHSGEKPFICNICKKSFILKRSLDRHMQLHTR